MVKKGEQHVVKVQVEAKNPPRRKPARRAGRAKAAPKPAIPKAFIENMVALQRAETSVVEKLDKISNQMSTLLSLFETAAKSFAENPALQIFGRDREFVEKINKLLEQDKIIARTLLLMQDKLAQKESSQPAYAKPEQAEYAASTFMPMAPPSPQPPQPLPPKKPQA